VKNRPQDKMDNSARKSTNRFTKIINLMQEKNKLLKTGFVEKTVIKPFFGELFRDKRSHVRGALNFKIFYKDRGFLAKDYSTLIKLC